LNLKQRLQSGELLISLHRLLQTHASTNGISSAIEHLAIIHGIANEGIPPGVSLLQCFWPAQQ
jgi:hypothetical protein